MLFNSYIPVVKLKKRKGHTYECGGLREEALKPKITFILALQEKL